MYLDQTTRSLKVLMAGAAATTNSKVLVCWTVTNNEGIETKGSTTPSTTSGTNEVEICAAPTTQGFVVNVKSIHLNNIDTAAVTPTIFIDDSGTNTVMAKKQLQVGQSLVYSFGPAGMSWDIV